MGKHFFALCHPPIVNVLEVLDQVDKATQVASPGSKLAPADWIFFAVRHTDVADINVVAVFHLSAIDVLANSDSDCVPRND